MTAVAYNLDKDFLVGTVWTRFQHETGINVYALPLPLQHVLDLAVDQNSAEYSAVPRPGRGLEEAYQRGGYIVSQTLQDEYPLLQRIVRDYHG
jgi:hypothetical protein